MNELLCMATASHFVLFVTEILIVVILYLQVISIYGTGFTNVKDTKITIGNAPPGSYKVPVTFQHHLLHTLLSDG